MELVHPGVPVGFGQDAGRRNGGQPAVSAHQAFVGDEGVGPEAVAVHQEEFRAQAQAIHCQVHGPDGGLKDVDPVDLGSFHPCHGPGQSFSFDERAEGLPLGFPQLLGVVEQGMRKSPGQDDGSGKDRSGQTAAAGLVQSGFQGAFGIMGRQHENGWAAKYGAFPDVQQLHLGCAFVVYLCGTMQQRGTTSRTRPVAIWLLVGVFMIMVQVLLGGITRLTGSGLSITDWDPIMGALPPLNHQQWMAAFHLYQQTPQYRLVNADFTLANFKAIFFWEWFHRNWARLIGVVFLVPFIWFLIKRRFQDWMIRPLVILFLLGGLQGLIGWVMVKSGLVGDNVSVNPIKLSVHFMTAMVLLCYTLWFALMLLVPDAERTGQRGQRRLTVGLIALLALQLTYGGFMAGLHAALSAHTWPDINGMLVPDTLWMQKPWWVNLTNNPITVQFIHRGLGYTIALLLVYWWARARRLSSTRLSRRWYGVPVVLVFVQVCLGILILIHSQIHIPVFWGVLHQMVAMLLLVSLFINLYLTGGTPRRS